MTNVTILWLYQLRQLRNHQPPILAKDGDDSQENKNLTQLSDDCKEKETLAQYFISLVCLDDFSEWRNLQRPASLPQARSDPPIGFQSPSISREFYTANFWEGIDAVELPESKGDDIPSDAAEGKDVAPSRPFDAETGDILAASRPSEENSAPSQPSEAPKTRKKVLRLGSKDESSPLYAVQGFMANLALADGDDSGDALPSDSDLSGSWSSRTGFTSPNTSGEKHMNLKMEESSEQKKGLELEKNQADTPECAGCLHNARELHLIEMERIPKAKREMRSLFASRAKEDGMRVALEEVFFRQEGLELYKEVQSKLEALADQVDRLQSGYIEEEGEENHECLGRGKGGAQSTARSATGPLEAGISSNITIISPEQQA